LLCTGNAAAGTAFDVVHLWMDFVFLITFITSHGLCSGPRLCVSSLVWSYSRALGRPPDKAAHVFIVFVVLKTSAII
jgi:hypothetical protein